MLTNSRLKQRIEYITLVALCKDEQSDKIFRTSCPPTYGGRTESTSILDEDENISYQNVIGSEKMIKETLTDQAVTFYLKNKYGLALRRWNQSSATFFCF